jgi:DNA-binding NtrC family response regulator
MELLVFDEVKSRRTQIVEALEKKRYKVVHCSTSNEFLGAVTDSSPNLLLLDVDTWLRGRSMYSYFNISRKLEKTPILFYNAPANFVAINDRERNDRDYILQKPTEVDSILQAVSQSLS